MKDITAERLVTEMRKIFAAFGLPVELISDNGPQLRSELFELFLKRNGIHHKFSPLYNPATNGLAERSFQTFKRILAKSDSNLPLQHRLADILFHYRNTPHSVTGKTPTELFLRRALRTRLACLKPSLQTTVQKRQQQQKDQHDKAAVQSRQFNKYQTVKIRELRGGREKCCTCARKQT